MWREGDLCRGVSRAVTAEPNLVELMQKAIARIPDDAKRVFYIRGPMAQEMAVACRRRPWWACFWPRRWWPARPLLYVLRRWGKPTVEADPDWR